MTNNAGHEANLEDAERSHCTGMYAKSLPHIGKVVLSAKG